MRRDTGEVVTLVRRPLLWTGSSVRARSLVPGRVLHTSIGDGHANISLHNLHNYDLPAHILEAVIIDISADASASASSPSTCSLWFAGDFNTLAPGGSPFLVQRPHGDPAHGQLLQVRPGQRQLERM